MLLSNLPLDTLEELTKAVNDVDSKSLRALSLVSRAFRSPSQRQLFRSIVITISPKANYDRRIPPSHHFVLLEVLQGNPMIGAYVKGVHFLQVHIHMTAEEIVHMDKNFIVDHGTLISQIVDLLPHVRTFSILNVQPSRDIPPMKWSDICTTLQDSFLRLFSQSTLASIHLDGMLLPSNIFSAFIHLKHLIFANITWTDDGLLTTPSFPEKKPQLSSLNISASSLSLANLTSAVDLTTITKIYLNVDQPQPNLTSLSSLSNLQSLNLSFTNGWDDMLIDLSQLRSLKDLAISYGRVPSNASWIENILDRLPDFLLIEAFDLKIEPTRQSLSLMMISTSIPSRRLSNVLSDFHKRFRGTLERIKVEMELKRGYQEVVPGEEVQRIKSEIRDSLLWEGCEGVLELEFSGDF